MKKILSQIFYFWRKKYKLALFIFAILIVIFIVFIECITNNSIKIESSQKIYDIVLALTGIVIFWYSRETADLKDISNKTIKELRKQVFLQQRPFIRLQWLTLENFGIRIINEGQGTAVNLFIKAKNKPVIHRTIVAAEIASKSYTDAGFADANLKNDDDFEKIFSPSRIYKLKVKYKDIAGNDYCQIFQTDKELNDKFELLEWDIPEDFKKLKFKRIKKL